MSELTTTIAAVLKQKAGEVWSTRPDASVYEAIVLMAEKSVGALLVMSLLITPGAAAAQITASPRRAVVYSVVFAELSAVGGMLLSLAPGVPVSVFVAFVSFGIYLVCRGVGRYRNAR